MLRLRLQVLLLRLQELRIPVRVREIFLPLPCLVREIPNIDHLHLLKLMIIETSEIPRRILLLARLREDAIHEHLLSFATDLRLPSDAARPVAETVHAHTDRADAVGFSAVDHLPGHARHDVLHADEVEVVVSHDGFAEEVIALGG